MSAEILPMSTLLAGCMRWTTAKRRTVGLGEKCNSNEQRYFPTITASALLYQIEQAGREE